MLREQIPGNAPVDLVFSLSGSTIPQDHGYSLYAAVSHIVTSVHSATNVGIFPIAGTSAGPRVLNLTRRSTLRVRLPATLIPDVISLAGKTLDLDGHCVRISVPCVVRLTPASTLGSSLVTIRLARAADNGVVTPDAFAAAATRQLEERGVRGRVRLGVVAKGPRAGEAKRRVIRIKGQTHVGYALLVEGLSMEESIALQEIGLGGRRLMGCGLFMPVRSQGTTRNVRATAGKEATA